MVQFGTGYFHPMDRDYGLHDHGNHQSSSPSSEQVTNDVGVRIGDLGISGGLGPIPNVQAIQAKIRPGSKKFEFVFLGRGKGSGQGETPEMYGLKQRQALREIGTANRVDWTTHSTVGVYGLAGMDQQGNFSKAAKQDSLLEVQRAIEFAADVGRGGPVVVHTGEFNRPIVDAKWNQKDGDPYADKFSMFPDEEGRTSYRVVDTRTGGVLQEARKNRKVARPVWLRYNSETNDGLWDEKRGSAYKDENGNLVQENDYVDYYGNKIEPSDRMPVFDTKEDRFKIQHLEWKDLEKEAVEFTERARSQFRKWDGMSNQEREKSIFRERIQHAIDNGYGESDLEIKPEEAYVIATLETNAAHSRGWAYQYGGQFDDLVKRVKKLRDAEKFYKAIEEEADPSQKERLKRELPPYAQGLVPSEEIFPSEVIKREIRQIENSMAQSREASASQWAQAEEAMENIRHVRSAENYALEEATDAYARLGINAMRHTMKLKDQGKLKKPIRLAMENLFPEHYGSHPDELIELVHGTQKRMVQLLSQQGVAEEEAWKTAKTHITSTLDTGHINMWRKYWTGDPKKDLAENDKDFNESDHYL